MISFFKYGRNVRLLGIILILCSTAGFSFIFRYYTYKADVAQSLNKHTSNRLESLMRNYKNFHSDRVRYMDYRILSPTLTDPSDKKIQQAIHNRKDYLEYEYKNSLVALGCLMESYVPHSMTCKEWNTLVMNLKKYPDMRKMDYQITESFKNQLSILGHTSKTQLLSEHRYRKLSMTGYDFFLLTQIFGIGLFPIAEIIDRSKKT